MSSIGGSLLHCAIQKVISGGRALVPHDVPPTVVAAAAIMDMGHTLVLPEESWLAIRTDFNVVRVRGVMESVGYDINGRPLRLLRMARPQLGQGNLFDDTESLAS